MLTPEYIELCKEESVSLWDMVLLVFIYEKQFDFVQILYDENFMEYSQRIARLEQRGYIKKFGPKIDDVTLRKTGEDLFVKYVGKRKKKGSSKVILWIDKWRELFPPGSNSIGFRYRGNRLEALKKMSKFVDSHDYTQEEIFKATENYVNRFSIRGFNYMMQAHYFIEKKDVGSTLESEIEQLKDNKEIENKDERGYGRTIR